MATATRHFDIAQLGIETVKGTIVPATRQIPCSWSVVEEQGFYRSDYPRSVRATRGGAGVIVSRGMTASFETELSPQDILWPLLTGIKGAISPVGAGGDKTWTFSPELNTAAITIDTASLECVRGDGTTNHYAREFGYGLTSRFGIAWAFNDIAKLTWDMFGRSSQTSIPTGSLTPYTNRQSLVSNLLKVYRDVNWAGLGGTQLTALVRSATLDVNTGLQPDYTLDGRSDLDMTGFKVAGPVAATLNLVLEFNSDGAARSFTDFRANTIEYIRLKNTGATIGGGVYTVQIDGAYRFTAPPAISTDGDVNLVTCSLEAVYDDTGTKILEFVAVNDLAAVA